MAWTRRRLSLDCRAGRAHDRSRQSRREHGFRNSYERFSRRLLCRCACERSMHRTDGMDAGRANGCYVRATRRGWRCGTSVSRSAFMAAFGGRYAKARHRDLRRYASLELPDFHHYGMPIKVVKNDAVCLRALFLDKLGHSIATLEPVIVEHNDPSEAQARP